MLDYRRFQRLRVALLAPSFFSKGGVYVEWTKLDRYDYTLFTGIIRIKLSGTNDPDLVDIMSEINRSDGRIYIEGQRFSYLDNYQICNRGVKSYLELYVAEL